jgi:sec-independent protein translocase protein TatB
MFEVGYSEILVIAIVLIVVVGPKDLPKMLRAFGKAMTRFRQVSGDFRRQFDDALKEADLDEVRKTIDDVRKLDPRQQVRDVLNPLRSAADSIRNDVQNAVRPVMQSNPNGAPKVEVPAAAPLMAAKPKAKLAKAKAAADTTVEPVKSVGKPKAKSAAKPAGPETAKAASKSDPATAAKPAAKPPAKPLALAKVTKIPAAAAKPKPASKIMAEKPAASKPAPATPSKPAVRKAKS